MMHHIHRYQKNTVQKSQTALRCEGKIGSPQDSEWVIDSDNKICFLQTRPISAI